MKGLFIIVATEVVLTVWPQGRHFYLGEPVILTCDVERTSSEVWIYTWFRHNLSMASTPGRDHRVWRHTYSVSALTSEDSGEYWCKAQKQDSNFTLRSKPLALSVTADSPPASLKVLNDTRQHMRGEQFSLCCSVHGVETADWTLKRLHNGAEVISGCLQMEGRFNLKTCSYNNITVGLSGLYWCEAAKGDQRSKSINITVSDGHLILHPAQPVTKGQTVNGLCKTFYKLNPAFICKDGMMFMNNTNVMMENVTKAHEGFYKCVNHTAAIDNPESWLLVRDSEEESAFIAVWVWVVCAVIIILLLIPVIILLVPSLRKRVKFFPKCGEFNAFQEMPRTKQDATEIQWDLAWMEMTNLLDKPNPGR